MGEMKRNRLGSLSLVAAIGGFLVVELQPWLPLAGVALFGGLTLKGLLEAFFEASLAGAFADWFAVSALFKDPVGIRLPHTNIIARNKDSIAAAVPRFLTGFVTDRAIGAELAKVDFASKAAEIIASGRTREDLRAFLKRQVAELLAGYGGSDEAKSAALRSFVDRLLAFAGERVDAPGELGALLGWARKEGFDERVIEGIAEYARLEIGRNRAKLIAILTPIVKRNAGWKGLFINAGTIENTIVSIQDELAEVKSDKANELRRFVLSALTAYVSKLEPGSPGESYERDRLSSSFREALADEGFRGGFSRFVAGLLSRLGEDLAGEDSRFIPSLEGALDAIASGLEADEELRSRFNKAAASLIGGALERGRVVEGLTEYLAGLLRATDERAFVDRIEEAVWNDLQYIRLNGAVVGGLVGLAIALAKAALSGR
jgi:uncharacterized membrane-anchored protein YjiN (DUF445 family)